MQGRQDGVATQRRTGEPSKAKQQQQKGSNTGSEALGKNQDGANAKDQGKKGWWRELDVLFCAGGIYFFYMFYAVLQEQITCTDFGEQKERFIYPMFLMFVQCVANFLTAAPFLFLPGGKAEGGITGALPVQSYALMAFTYLGGMLSSYEALKFINFPTAVLAKSCKMIPVMIMGALIGGKKYGWRSYVCMAMVTVGISAIMFYKKTGAKGDEGQTASFFGLLLTLVSLTMDGITGGLQDKAESQAKKPSTFQMMFNINLWASVELIIALAVTGQGLEAITFCQRHPSIIWDMFLFCITSALGQMFIFRTINHFGPLTTSLITTTRKFFTVIFSLIFFNHTLNSLQWGGVVLVFGGLGWDIWTKYHITPKKKN